MTNKERLISLMGFTPQDNLTEGELIDSGINGTSTYAAGTSIGLKKCAVNILQVLLSTADTNDNNNGIDIRYDREAILKRLGILKDQIGDVDDVDYLTPTINKRTPW